MTALGFPFHQATVYKIEKSTRPVRVEEAQAFASVFGTSVAELIGEPSMDDEGIIQVRLAQLELARLDTALTRALLERNDSQRRLNEIVRSQGKDVPDSNSLLELHPFDDDDDGDVA